MKYAELFTGKQIYILWKGPVSVSVLHPVACFIASISQLEEVQKGTLTLSHELK